MFPGHSHDIHIEQDAHSPVLTRLAALDDAAPLATPALIAHIGSEPVAALSLVDGRSVADPFRYTEPIRTVLSFHARGIRAAERRPSLIERIRLYLRGAGVVPAT